MVSQRVRRNLSDLAQLLYNIVMVFAIYPKEMISFETEVLLTYNILGMQHSDSVLLVYILFQFFSLIGYYKPLNIVCCAIHYVLVICIC